MMLSMTEMQPEQSDLLLIKSLHGWSQDSAKARGAQGARLTEEKKTLSLLSSIRKFVSGFWNKAQGIIYHSISTVIKIPACKFWQR